MVCRDSCKFRYGRLIRHDVTTSTTFTPAWRLWSLILASMICSFGCAGCAVSMAVEQPSKKNLNVLESGTPRSMVLAEFGRPFASRMVNHRRLDAFQFVQGYSRGARAGRALMHGAADMATAGLWEFAATPAEGYFSGTHFACEVLYDEQDRVFRWRAVAPRVNTERPYRH